MSKMNTNEPMTGTFRLILVIGALLLTSMTARADGGPRQAIANLSAAQGQSVSGTVTFIEVVGGVQVIAEVKGLTPGRHGFHIHEKSDLSAPDLMSAGGHFNPGGHPHGGPQAAARHAGDLGNLDADTSGYARLEFVDKAIKLSGPDTIIGRSVIVHADADDLKSQPSGAAGARVAGGVIKADGL